MALFVTLSLVLASYLLGAVPFSLLLGLARGTDIRKVGSGNVGATNLSRALGWKWGYLAFFLDFAKGALPVVGALALESRAPGSVCPQEGGWVPVLAGLSAILGHVFPVYLGFRGGKGVATTFGVMAALSPLAAVLAGAVWGIVFVLARLVSVASLAAAVALPLGVWLFEQGSRPQGSAAVQAFAIAIALLIVVRHGENIRRLLRGEELAPGRRGSPSGDAPAPHDQEGRDHGRS